MLLFPDVRFLKRLTYTFCFPYLFQVSRDEWFQLWEEYAKNPSNASEWQQDYMSVTFQLFDASGKFIILSVRRIMKKKTHWHALFPIPLEGSLNIYERIWKPRQTETFEIINDDQYKNIRSLFTKLWDIKFENMFSFYYWSIRFRFTYGIEFLEKFYFVELKIFLCELKYLSLFNPPTRWMLDLFGLSLHFYYLF